MKKAPFVWGPEVRVRQAGEEEILARTRRSGSTGSWLVERRGGVINPITGGWAPGSGGWHPVSTHLTEAAASLKKAALEKRINKEMGK